MIYIFDGSFYGWLCCVFECFEMKEWHAKVMDKKRYQPDMFQSERLIYTDVNNATRVLRALKKKFGTQMVKDIYRAFLSEDVQAWQAAFYLVRNLFQGYSDIINDFGDSNVLYFHQTLKKVQREGHRMKAFVRFSKSNDGLFFSLIAPDFNVLPLIVSFFKNRYADQVWLLYDVKRSYGFYYDTKIVTEVKVTDQSIVSNVLTEKTIDLDENDILYQNLWKQYFKSTNIVERKNIKLHLQHVPKRYWNYLVEKQK